MKSVLTDDIFHLLQTVGDFQIGLVVRPAEPLDANRLGRALSELVTALPVLGCMYVPGWRCGHWEKIDQAEEQMVTTASAADIDEQINTFFTCPVDPCTGPQVKCLLLSGEQNLLCLNVSHFVGDAAGVRELAYMLCRAYNTPDSLKPGQHDRGLDILFKHFSAGRKLGIPGRMIRDIAAQPPFPPSATLPNTPGQSFERRYVIQHMGPEVIRCLQDLAAKYRATPNDVLMAAFVRALMPLAAPGIKPAWRLVVTADLRRHLPPEKRSGQVCNLSGWVFTGFGRDPGNSLAETCGLVSAQMNRLKDDYLGLGMIPLTWLTARGLPLAVGKTAMEKLAPMVLQRVPVAPSFTNMGRIDPQALAFDDRSAQHAFLLAPIVFAPILGVGISAFDDTMTISAGFNVPGFDPADITALLKGIVTEIRSA